MTLSTCYALLIALLITAVIPGPSVMSVVSHTVNSNLRNGLLMSLGILIADYVFVVVTLTGLSSIASQLDTFIAYITYIGASYLIFLAYKSWYATIDAKALTKENSVAPPNSSLLAGVIIGLSNPKAVLFYLAFFPAFIELQTMTSADLLLILTIVTIAISSVFISYAFIGIKAQKLFNNKQARLTLNRLSSLVLLSCAFFLIYRT